MKKIFSVFFVTLLLISGAYGCTAKSSLEKAKPEPQTKANKLTIGLSVSTLNNPFFVSLKNGAEKAAKAANADLISLDAQNDTAKQISAVEDLIQKRVDILLVNPTDSDAVGAAIKSANTANIPVITLDRAANSGKVVAHIASDNVKGGKLAGDYLLKAIGSKGNLVELQGLPGTSAARDRGKGFHDAVDNQPGVKVISSQAADFDRAKGLSVMENILQGNKDIQGVFAHNDEMALGAMQAVAASNRKIVIVGFDATDDAVKAVNDGKMAATVAQKPELIGEAGVQTAIKVKKGEKVDEFIPVELELVTK